MMQTSILFFRLRSVYLSFFPVHALTPVQINIAANVVIVRMNVAGARQQNHGFNVNVALSIMDYISPPIIRPSVSAAAIF